MNTNVFSQCPVCGDSSEAARNAMLEYEVYVVGAGVCSACADRIANAYSKKHSGEWLTWPEEAKAVPQQRKAVISQALRTKVFERDKYRCLRCETHLNLRADHVIPESKGGLTSLENLQTLCLSCNSWKGTKTIDFRASSNER